MWGQWRGGVWGVCWVGVAALIRRRRTSDTEAGQSLMLYGLLWLIVYDAAFVTGYVGAVAGGGVGGVLGGGRGADSPAAHERYGGGAVVDAVWAALVDRL